MWHKFHILGPKQVLVVTSVSAVAIALAVGLASIPADGTSMNRFLGPSRQFDPFINFGSVFVSVLPVFLGYYHLARLGGLLGLVVSAAMCIVTRGVALLVFALELAGHSEMFQEATYIAACLLLSVLVFAVHMKASTSRVILDAQRSLLVPDLQTL